MSKKAVKLVMPDGTDVVTQIPKVKGVHPFGSKILVETLKASEVMGTSLAVDHAGADTGDAPQAYIVELGPQVPEDSGLKVGQRVYWEGKGMAVKDPRAEHGRVRALLEISNIRAIIEE